MSDARDEREPLRAEGWVSLIETARVPIDDNVFVEAEGIRLLVHHLASGFYVTSSQCPHEDFTMERCPLRDGAVVCTEHGWAMDVRTGSVVEIGDEDARLPTYEARVHGERVYAKLF